MAEPMIPVPGAQVARATKTPHLHVPRLVVSHDVAGARGMSQSRLAR